MIHNPAYIGALMSFVLSKSTFMYGNQCEKRLYFHKFKPEYRNPPDPAQELVFAQGTDLGMLARNLFPGGLDLTPETPYQYTLSAQKTLKSLPVRYVFYEPVFIGSEVMCALDILVRKNSGLFAFEVKSGTSAKPQYIEDAALQYWVMKKAGYEPRDFSLILINKHYEFNGNLDVNQLFYTESILEQILELQEQIELKVAQLKKLLKQKVQPEINPGMHCFSPYTCDFSNHCWKGIPTENSVLDLSHGIGWKFFEEGYRSLDELPANLELPPRAAFQLKVYRSGETVVDKEKISAYLSQVDFPLGFLDFESYQSSVPNIVGTRPYQRIPFQFSLHSLSSKKARLKSGGFLGDGISDPRPGLVKQLIADCKNLKHIFVYSIGFERSVLNELAAQFPEYADELLQIAAKLVDLMTPFQQRWYYHSDMKGGYSIKVMLPHFFPEMSYEDLPIGDGGTASMAYASLTALSAEEREEIRNQLVTYCNLDTLAMVKIWEKLQSIC